jgi:hypothetical protein
VPASRQHQLQVGSFATYASERLEEQTVILVWPEPRRVKQKRFPLLGALPKDRVIDAVWHHPDKVRIDAEARLSPLLHEATRDDDEIRPAGRAVVRQRSEGSGRSRNEFRMVAMQEVVKRDDVWNADARQRN